MQTLFLRLLAEDDKEAGLSRAIADLAAGRENKLTYTVDPGSFGQVPGSPFAYWVSDRIRRLFRELPPFDNESEGRATRCGLGTTDNFRFLRLNWEVPEAARGIHWLPYYDGGVYSPVYDVFPLVVWWPDSGREIKEFVASKFGSASRNVRGEDHYMKPGFIFPRRTKGLCPKIMASGGIFSNAGQAGFVPRAELLTAIGILTSEISTLLISLSQGRTGDAAQFEVGLIKRLPWIEALDQTLASTLSSLTRAICDAKRRVQQGNEVAPEFVAPHALLPQGRSLRQGFSETQSFLNGLMQRVSDLLTDINLLVLEAYKIAPEDRLNLASYADQLFDSDLGSDTDDEPGDADRSAEPDLFAQAIVSYTIGNIFGRWDLRYATGEKKSPDLSDPLDDLPTCSPGMLQGGDGLPIATTPRDYPLRIDWDGILVNDPDHPDDIIRRVRDVLELIWKDRAEANEQEACAILGVANLRDYFRKPGPGGFWDDHIKRYSKSRRKAPIYWLLQSSKKNYALWIYYHRLDKDILFKALLHYVEPKVRLVNSQLTAIRGQLQQSTDDGKRTTDKKRAKEAERLEGFLSELQDFEDRLRRAANLHLEPDLNDGVVLNIAPLWELVPWKEARSYWNELMDGKYEWSSIGKQLREKGLVK